MMNNNNNNLRDGLNSRNDHSVSTESLVELADVVLKNIFLSLMGRFTIS